MTGVHTLTVALDTSGFAWAFTCPHDGTNAADLPEDQRPDCRTAGGDCTGRTALVAAGGPTRTWGGQILTLATIPVQLIHLDGGTLLEHAPTAGPGPDEAARQLARASGHPRYTETDTTWRRLYEQPANVEHAYRQALRRGATPKTDIDTWCGVLRDWHEREALADADEALVVSAGADPL